MRGYRLTVRAGATVGRERFDDLDAAVAELERRAEEIRREGRLGPVKMLRKFEPGQQVAGRLEISTGGWLGGSAAGVDVMGDGELVPYSGGLRREQLKTRGSESAFDAVRRALRSL